jgi:molecular chaperone DnaK (HSP70)
LVGIDLGTANCAVASVDLTQAGEPLVQDFGIPQLVRLGQVDTRATLPSCLYLPDAQEFPPGALALPWDEAPTEVVGELARWHGARVPGRLVVSAKSWLCHAAVDRAGRILPWGAGAGVPRVSPVEASARFLKHLARAWDQAHPDAPLAAQDVVITVPASFDAVARSLTVDAARDAGLSGFTLVEEPQAAFESFVWSHRDQVAALLDGVRLILVVDVGGGTTDFTLVEVSRSETGPAFRRIAVGEHLMLGGDNMDMALARQAEERVVSGGRRLNAGQWSQWVQACREAKETLLGEGTAEECRVAVAGSGSALMGGSLTARLTREDVVRTVLDGFLAPCGPDDTPRRTARLALQEVGLPYAQDPSIPRQLAGFLAAHRAAGWAALAGSEAAGDAVERRLPRPDAILLNGGVFRSARIAGRLLEVVSGWWPGEPPIRNLAADSLDLAVARGAACHGLARRGLARRVTGGASHAVYVGLDTGAGGGRSALCVIPRGMEEGTTSELGGRTFRLMLGRPVQFPLFTSTSDRVEAAGAVVRVEDDWTPLSPLHAVLRSAGAKAGTATVHLRATLTEIGTLELWCVSDDSDERWRLEFELRGRSTGGVQATGEVEAMPRHWTEARQAVEGVFPPRGRSPGGDVASASKTAKQLLFSLERSLGQRSEWRLPVLRELWGVAFAGATRRRRSAEHERVFFQLCGYALRPGFGYPVDDWRCEQMAGLFSEVVHFGKERPVWTEFWVAWRRIAGGLSAERQLEIWSFLKPHLASALAPDYPKHLGRPKGVQPEGLHEMVRLGASLEHLDPAVKEEFGGWVAAQLLDPAGAGGPWAWALGRLGSRVPLYGSAHQTVTPLVAETWMAGLEAAQARGVDGALFAMAQIARRTGDRALDLSDAVRERVLGVLGTADGPASWARMVREVSVLEGADEARAIGDTLPVGLALQG